MVKYIIGEIIMALGRGNWWCDNGCGKKVKNTSKKIYPNTQKINTFLACEMCGKKYIRIGRKIVEYNKK